MAREQSPPGTKGPQSRSPVFPRNDHPHHLDLPSFPGLPHAPPAASPGPARRSPGHHGLCPTVLWAGCSGSAPPASEQAPRLLSPSMAPSTPPRITPDLSMFLYNFQVTFFSWPPLQGNNHKPPFAGEDIEVTCPAVNKDTPGPWLRARCLSSATSLQGTQTLHLLPSWQLERTKPLGLGFLDKLSSHSVPPCAFQWLWEHRACGVPAPPTTTWTAKRSLPVPTQPSASAQGSECPAHLPPTQSPSVSSLSRAGPSGLIQRFLGSVPNLTPTL